MQLIEGRPRGQASAMIAGKGQAAKKAAKAAKAAAHRAAEKGVGDLAHLALEVWHHLVYAHLSSQSAHTRSSGQ